MHEKSFPASDVQLSDMSSDIGLSFDDDEAVVLDEPELQASELSFDDDEAVVLDEPELQVSELSFDDDEAVALDEAGVQEPELSFDDDEAVALDEAELQASELFFDDQEATLTIEEPELSFEEVGSELTLEPVSAVCAPTERLDASAGFMLEEPSGAEDFSPLPVERPEVESFSIVTCGQPRKISETSISLPIIIRLNKNDAECPLTITISLDDMQPK